MALQRTRISSYILIIVTAWLTSCTVSVPERYSRIDRYPVIFPDYTNITIPSNIAPLNFCLPHNEDDGCVARISIEGRDYLFDGTGRIEIPEDEWHEMLTKARKGGMTVELFVENSSSTSRESERGYSLYKSFTWKVAEPIDRYVSYRLIPPSYTMYEELRLCQRDLTSFDENVFYDNKRDDGSPDHCINCHSYQNYDTRRMQFHVREKHGGTVIADDGEITKRNLKRPYTIGAGVYPAWHPTLDLIAYSTDKTMQHFHNADGGKVEVQDSRSDLILYDVKHDSVINVSTEPLDLEVFPSWSPDGRYLYYSSATVADTTKQWIRENYRQIRYNIYRRPFDQQHLTFGTPELIVDAARDSLSALLPRVSPDGKYLLYSLAPYGVFHIWHKESDLYCMRLADGLSYPLTAANSGYADSYHNWSSNGRWVVFTSRRDDGNFTRLYFAYIDSHGVAGKAFEMPQQYPFYELTNVFSYNIPEFTRTPVTIPQSTFRSIIVGSE